MARQLSRSPRAVRRRLALEIRREMQAVLGVPVQWGLNDCVLFQSNPQVRAGLRDPLGKLRGAWSSEVEAQAVLGPKGLLGAMRGAARRCGWSPVEPDRSSIGDVGLCLTEHGATVVSKLTAVDWVGRSECGWRAVPTDKVFVAWKVI